MKFNKIIQNNMYNKQLVASAEMTSVKQTIKKSKFKRCTNDKIPLTIFLSQTSAEKVTASSSSNSSLNEDEILKESNQTSYEETFHTMKNKSESCRDYINDQLEEDFKQFASRASNRSRKYKKDKNEERTNHLIFGLHDTDDEGYAGSASSNDLGETCSSTSSDEKKSPSSSSYSSSNEEEVVEESNQCNKKRSFETMENNTDSWQNKSARDQMEQEFKHAVTRACNRSRRYQKTKYEEQSKHILFDLSVDNMGTIMSFLDPREVHVLLTMPVSKTWRQTFTIPQDLWKILCISEPFYARVSEHTNDNSDNSFSSFPRCEEGRHLIGRYRLLYTSFIRCMKYLARIKDDALNGRPPSGLQSHSATNNNSSSHPFKNNVSLKNFFAKARELRHDSESDSSSASWNGSTDHTEPSELTPDSPVGGSDDDSMNKKPSKKKKEKLKRKYGHSKLTGNLLGPSKGTGVPGHVDLPWSCAIYSIVNWMHAFQDVEGIQVMCLRVLPFLLEDETQRTTAQRAGLTDIVLRSMVLFPNSIELHTASFHTIVLLARPLGGREGMLFHSAMVNASGIFNVGSATGKNGIAVMIDSMRRFADDEVLQAMSCWSMVNIALIPSQKVILVKLGGIMVAADAMMRHPYNAEVQFRALFALINLVIPSDNEEDVSPEAMKDLGVEDLTEREILDENVNQITNLVVVAMKNFCSSEAILNRACLVLHNLSLNERYHTALLWTPNCYQMLEWCINNYHHSNVLQHSAVGTLQRLQVSLANDPDIRLRFSETIRVQQQNSLEQTRRDAVYLHEQQLLMRNNLYFEK